MYSTVPGTRGGANERSPFQLFFLSESVVFLLPSPLPGSPLPSACSSPAKTRTQETDPTVRRTRQARTPVEEEETVRWLAAGALTPSSSSSVAMTTRSLPSSVGCHGFLQHLGALAVNTHFTEAPGEGRALRSPPSPPPHCHFRINSGLLQG